ncbi:hypothetical protein PPERSA_12756 [Pseudocohnilembus persalinus]|uniref:ubiquitinyl hydrolase 1 n=1 Tax=Pseudocohnilembus persalinus TaxID=266149 RepID=A0A0V0QU96_PSEPJ|nr:hypothetical protein PPERSA_12756 [Pseudocohnilembus persalinus]|eukprot:KRX05578.1 hypothetical protein PPERSA_12756 [Pseudocohnilembus persalinus]
MKNNQKTKQQSQLSQFNQIYNQINNRFQTNNFKQVLQLTTQTPFEEIKFTENKHKILTSKDIDLENQSPVNATQSNHNQFQQEIQTLYQIVHSAFFLKKYALVVHYFESSLSAIIQQFLVEDNIKTFKLVYLSYEKMNRIQVSIKIINLIISIHIKSKENKTKEIEKLQNQINEYQKIILQNQKNKAQRKNEAQKVFEILQQSEKLQYMETEGLPVYLIPMKWFDNWQKYTHFLDLQNNVKRRKSSDFLDQEQIIDYDFYPGNLDCSHLIDINSTDNILYDPDQTYNHQNNQIKSYLKEGKDEKDEKEYEILLKKIKILVFPCIKLDNANKIISNTEKYLQNHSFSCFASKKDTISDLRKKILRSFINIPDVNQSLVSQHRNFKLLKLNDCQDEQLIVEHYLNAIKENQTEINLPFEAQEIEPQIPLEEAEIAIDDIILIQFNSNQVINFTSRLTQSKIVESLQKCANCGKSQNIIYCQCKKVKYCDKQCQKAHRPEHKQKCLDTLQQIDKQKSFMKKFGISEKQETTQKSRMGLTGLQNLGNTCFMNSSLQCLSNVDELTQYMISHKFIKDLNPSNPIGSGGYLASSYAELMKELWLGSKNSVAPWNLKKIIGKLASQFSGYSQQDSYELLSYLLDGIHEDLNRVKQKPYIEAIESDGTQVEEIAEKSWENYLKRNNSIITDLFVGQFKSILNCPVCNKISITFDPFMAISLPIPSEKNQIQISFYLIYRDPTLTPAKITLDLDKNATTQTLMQEVTNKVREPVLDPQFLQFCLVESHKIQQIFPDDYLISDVLDKEGAYFLIQQKIESLSDDDLQSETICLKQLQNIDTENLYLNKQELIQEFEQIYQPDYNFPYLLVTDTNQQLITNEWYCSKCKELRRASKKMEIQKLPKILILHFKRFKTNGVASIGTYFFSAGGQKINLQIDFPIQELDLTDYVHQPFQNQELQKQNSNNYSQNSLNGTNNSSSSKLKKNNQQSLQNTNQYNSNQSINQSKNQQKQRQIYDLISVSNHYGSMGGGHYTAYAKNSQYNKWIEYDDSSVSQISEDQIVTEASYVCFYRLRESQKNN